MNDLNNLRHYIEFEAPLIINVPPQVVEDHLLRDTHYRNLVETGTSLGNTDQIARSRWENRLFGGLYRGSTAFERPKYGSLSLWVGNGYTVKSSYGCSIILLKRQNLKDRITLTLGDSSNGQNSSSIATLKHYDHLLNEMKNLKELLEFISTPNRVGMKEGLLISRSEFIEIQIHGEVKLVGIG
eukprot:TRINITY_DN10463_c0_g1_i1.p1 TRINITY_DN10463_c0_g1~~TRINITY_DN10463_c0_g1_i1.p1  ORF type:complete len:184 (-),score=48.62 TRINITY_DN10463_c0_g1_i1:66-617(-)